jgi:molecular chaperone DnaK (HSP70)
LKFRRDILAAVTIVTDLGGKKFDEKIVCVNVQHFKPMQANTVKKNAKDLQR